MTCSFCGSRNNEDEHRCNKCGRRPGDTLNGEFSMARTQGALATQFELRPRIMVAEPQGPKAAVRGVHQMRLPGLRSKVVEFSEFAPPKPPAQRPAAKAPVKSAAVKAPPVRTGQAKAKTTNRRRGASADQGSLDFMPPQSGTPRTLTTTVEAVVSCDLPAATALHRAVAAALDWSMVLLAYGLFLAVFFGMGGGFTWNRLNLTVFGGALLLVGFSYGLTWALLGADSAGMRWMGLRLITFEGFPLERRQRLLRFGGSCLSFCTVLGQLWGLWDEESLTWQDHISGTFPTPRRVHAEVFRRA